VIVTTVPSTKRRPGGYAQYKFVPSGNQLTPLPLRIVAVAQGSTAGTLAVDTPTQIFDEDDADAKAGRGSELALMLRKMFDQAALMGASPEIWACRVDAPAGVAAQNTLTVTGTATGSGTLALRAAGRTLYVGVSTGDSADTVAAAIKAQWDLAASDLPGTAAVTTNVVTVTAAQPGVTGNDTVFSTDTPIAGLTVGYAQSIPGTGVANIATALDALFSRDYDAVALANHAAADVTNAIAHVSAAWGYSQQRPRHVVIGERGSLGTAQALATAANDKSIIVVNAEGTGSTPGEIAAAAALAWFSFEAPNVNMDGTRLALFAPAAALAYTDTEVESALAGGVTPLTPTADGQLKIEMLITTATSLAGVPFEGLKEAAMSRTAAWMGRQIHARFTAEFRQEVLTTSPQQGISVLDRIRDMVVSVQRAAESLGYIRNVDDYLEQIIVEEAVAPAGRVNVTNPFRVAGPLHQAVFVHTMYL
jgi:phage tail sheath gpL-like